MKALTALTLLASAMVAIPAAAQYHPTTPDYQEVKIINSKGSDSIQQLNVYNIFLENSPRSFHVPGAPRFAIEGSDHKFYLGIGGKLKATVSYDWGHPIHVGHSFRTSNIPMHQAPGNGGLTQFNIQQSGLYLNFVALPGEKNQIGVYISTDLLGNNNGFDLNFAYIKWRGLTAGYYYSLFTDIAACPPTIDHQGPNAFTFDPRVQVSYTYNFNNHWSIAGGLEDMKRSATYTDATSQVSQRVPDFPVYLQYAWGGGKSWLRASALFRSLLYRDNIAQCNHTNFGWGIKLSGSAQLCPFITAYYQGLYGHGISSYIQDLGGLGLDMVPSATKPGKLNSVKSWGAYLGLQYNISRTVYATTTYSHVRDYAKHYDGGDTPWADQYKYGQYAVANVFWQITPIITTGIEYIYGRRVNFSGEKAHDSRLQTMLQVSF